MFAKNIKKEGAHTIWCVNGGVLPVLVKSFLSTLYIDATKSS